MTATGENRSAPISGSRAAASRRSGSCAEDADHSIDAEGAIVTPGFIDLHTHYDGQISWDEEMRPSVNFGVTTVLMGNCGVGFAPVRPKDHDRLIRLMEGVEDIPGTALHEGSPGAGRAFGDYLDQIDGMPHTIDFAAMAVHDPIRVYAMGERATHREVGERRRHLRTMHRLLQEALDAGAAGFSIGRSDIHRTADGDWTPSSEASREELIALASVHQRPQARRSRRSSTTSTWNEKAISFRTNSPWSRRLRAPAADPAPFP